MISSLEARLGIKAGRGNNYVEFDAFPYEYEIVTNRVTGAREFIFKGDVDISNRNPKFKRNR